MKILISERLSPNKYKTPEGYLICKDAVLARTGKQTYRRNEIFADNSDEEIDVDRLPSEVFSPATIASFENKPVVYDHPEEDVNCDNYNEYAVGYVRDVHQGKNENGEDVLLGTLVITDGKVVDDILSGEHTDLSCGYDADIIDEAYPQQRNIRGNHVALCQQGRAGNAHIVDSVVKDAWFGGVEESKLRASKDFILKRLFQEWDELKRKGLSLDKEIRIGEIKEELEKRVKQLRNVPNDIYDSIKDVELCQQGRAGNAHIVDGVKRLPLEGDKNKIFMNATKNLYAKEIDELIYKHHFTKEGAIEYLIKKGYPKETLQEAAKLVDSVTRDSDVDWLRALDNNDIPFSFVEGGYGVKFNTYSNYIKAKRLAEKYHATITQWDDQNYIAYDYHSTRISNEDSIKDMALSRADAMERCISLGKRFIEHFDKIYKNKGSQEVNHWLSEMRSWLNSVRQIKLKTTNDVILWGELRDWFFTAGANVQDFMQNPTQEEIKAYDEFTNKLSSGLDLASALKGIGIKDKQKDSIKDWDPTVYNALAALPRYIQKYGTAMDGLFELRENFHLTKEEMEFIYKKGIEKGYYEDDSRLKKYAVEGIYDAMYGLVKEPEFRYYIVYGSGKDPKQAVAIAHSVKRKNDSIQKYQVQDGDTIHVVYAKDIADAIKQVKNKEK